MRGHRWKDTFFPAIASVLVAREQDPSAKTTENLIGMIVGHSKDRSLRDTQKQIKADQISLSLHGHVCLAPCP